MNNNDRQLESNDRLLENNLNKGVITKQEYDRQLKKLYDEYEEYAIFADGHNNFADASRFYKIALACCPKSDAENDFYNVQKKDWLANFCAFR